MTPRPRPELLAALNRSDNRDFPPPCCDKCAAAQKLVTIAECEFESAEMERAAAKHLCEKAHKLAKEAEAKSADTIEREARMAAREIGLRRREEEAGRTAFVGVLFLSASVCLAVAVAALELFVRWG